MRLCRVATPVAVFAILPRCLRGMRVIVDGLRRHATPLVAVSPYGMVYAMLVAYTDSCLLLFVAVFVVYCRRYAYAGCRCQR